MVWAHCISVLVVVVGLPCSPVLAMQSEKTDGDADLSKVMLGITVVSLGDVPNLQKDKDIKPPTRKGVIITEVAAYGPAVEAKLKEMDIITKVDNKPVATAEEFAEAVLGLGAGQEVEISGFRATAGPAPPNRKKVGDKVKWVKGSVKVTAMTKKEILLNSLVKQEDDVLEITKYVPKDPGLCPFYCYFTTKRGEAPILWLRVNYFGGDWIFMERCIGKVDDQTFEFGPSPENTVQRDAMGGSVREWFDHPVDEDTRKMLDAMVNSGRVIFRMQGDKYNKDYELVPADRQRIRTMLRVFEVMGGR